MSIETSKPNCNIQNPNVLTITHELFVCYYRIEPRDTISFCVDSKLPEILASFVLMKWMEIQCGRSIQPLLARNYVSLGEKFHLEHLKPAFVHTQIEIRSLLEKQEKRTLFFKITAHQHNQLIASAEHSRNIVPAKLFERLYQES